MWLSRSALYSCVRVPYECSFTTLHTYAIPEKSTTPTYLTQVTDRDYTDQIFFTQPQPNSWVQIKLEHYRVRPTAYVMAHRVRMTRSSPTSLVVCPSLVPTSLSQDHDLPPVVFLVRSTNSSNVPRPPPEFTTTSTRMCAKLLFQLLPP